jgi:hypothetical protein
MSEMRNARIVLTLMRVRRVFQERSFEKTVAIGPMREGMHFASRWSSNHPSSRSDIYARQNLPSV